MICLKRTLLPLPLPPMMVVVSPALDVQVHSLQHLFIGERFVQSSYFDHRRLKGRILLQKKSETRMITEATTTAVVVACPTPLAPPSVFKPK